MEIKHRSIELLPKTFSASLRLPLPSSIAASSVPPPPIKELKAETSIKIGKQIPTPVKALVTTSRICPMYIRSTMLYKTLTIWVIATEIAMLSMSLPSGKFIIMICTHRFNLLMNKIIVYGSIQKEYASICRIVHKCKDNLMVNLFFLC